MICPSCNADITYQVMQTLVDSGVGTDPDIIQFHCEECDKSISGDVLVKVTLMVDGGE